MSQTKTIEAETVHGSVQYEVVDCDSCGNEVSKKDAKPFFIGDVKEVSEWGYKNSVKVEFNKSDLNRGWACPYCHEDEPISFPKIGSSISMPRTLNPLALAVALIVKPPETVTDEFCRQTDLDDMDRGFIKAMLTFIWVGVLIIGMSAFVGSILI